LTGSTPHKQETRAAMQGKTPKKDTPAEKPPARDPALERAIEATACELQMGQYPIFCITTAKPGETRLTYRERVWIDSQEVLKEWCIQVTSHYGWPGEHEAEVWRAIQHIAELRGRAGTLTNPIQTTLEEIREHMSSKSRGGRQRKAIVHSLKCLSNTKLESTHWYDTAQKNYDFADFSIIAGLKISERELPDGKKVIDKVYISFEPVLFENIRKRYVRPLDKGYMDTQLDRWLAKRLYELLGIKFYGLRKKGVPYRTRYSRLCAMLGTKRQQHLSYARRVLGRAHQELQQTGFLEKIEWFPLLNVPEHDWMLRYWPGPRAKAAWKKDYWKLVPELIEPVFVEEPLVGLEPVFVEELPAQLDEGEIIAEVQTETAPEMPLQLPLLLEEPLQVQGAALAPPGRKSPSRASRKPQEPQEPPGAAGGLRKPQGGPEGAKTSTEPKDAPPSSYALEAVEAFERATGKHRRLARITAAEESCLLQWRAAGVTSQDIETGTRRALAEQKKGSSEDGRRAREVVSLAYVRGAVLDAAAKRQELEWMCQEAIRKVRAAQSAEAQEAEAALKNHLKARFRPEFYAAVFDNLLVAEKVSDCFIVLVPSDYLHPVYNSRADEFAKVLGLPSVFGDLLDWAKGL
jgi:hypothetical protein